MAENSSSQTQQIRDSLRRAVVDQAERLDAGFGELSKLEEKAMAQACSNLDEATRLTKVSIAYAGELAAQWRKLFVDAARRTADMVAGPQGE